LSKIVKEVHHRDLNDGGCGGVRFVSASLTSRQAKSLDVERFPFRVMVVWSIAASEHGTSVM
jgi:hypothetical protein